MKNTKKTVYIVQYRGTDNYGEVENSIEAVLERREDFDKWIDEHNKGREEDGNSPEDPDEFEVSMFCVETFENEPKKDNQAKITINAKKLDKQKKSLIKLLNGKELTHIDQNNIDALLNMCDAITDNLHSAGVITVKDV